jgi:hypothetical protein
MLISSEYGYRVISPRDRLLMIGFTYVFTHMTLTTVLSRSVYSYPPKVEGGLSPLFPHCSCSWRRAARRV